MVFAATHVGVCDVNMDIFGSISLRKESVGVGWMAPQIQMTIPTKMESYKHTCSYVYTPHMCLCAFVYLDMERWLVLVE